MAEINVVHKPAFPRWAWWLVALAVAILLWILFWNLWAPDRTGAALSDTSRSRAALSAATDPITDVYVVVTAPDRRALLGRQAQFSGVMVQDVVGDKTFWIGPSADKRMFVVLDEAPTSSKPGVEGRYNIEKGQKLNITGALVQIPDAETAKTLWGAPGANAAASEQIYLRANQIEIVKEGK